MSKRDTLFFELRLISYTLMNLPNRTGILLTKQKIQNYVNISISKFSLCFFIQNFRTF